MAEFDQVNVLVVDPDAKVREGVETVLREAGFSNLRLGATLDDITDGVGEATPDLAVYCAAPSLAMATSARSWSCCVTALSATIPFYRSPS